MSISSINLNKQLISLTPDALICLYEIDFSVLQSNFDELAGALGINLGSEPVYRFCSMENGTNPIVWQGKSYQPLPIKMDGFEHQSEGKLPRPTFTIANPEGILSKIVYSNKDFLNCKITRKRTFARFLDDENFQNRNLNVEGRNPFGESNEQSYLEDDVYFINRKTSEDKNAIQFELVSALELENSWVPARQILSDYCNWTYRCDIGCKYKGLPIETLKGKDLTKGFAKSPKKIQTEDGEFLENGRVEPSAYPSMISDIPEWNKYGKNGTEIEARGYKMNDVVKIIPSKTGNPYSSAPHVFVCIQDHEVAYNHHPHLSRDYWLKDECNKTIEACKKRFSEENNDLRDYNNSLTSQGLRFGGFPGTEKYSLE